MKPTLKPPPAAQKLQPPRRAERLSKTFWKLAQGTGVHTQSNEPVDIVKHLLAALGGLEGKRSDSQVTADALSFLLRLEGDPRYASPEQTRGGEKDRRALVYSIGVLLFERLTGHHPFVESLSPVEAAVVRDRCGVRGANNLCSLPGELRGVLNKALSPFPEDRYDGVAELRAALIRFVANFTLSQARASGSPPITARAKNPTPTPAIRQKRPTPPPCPGSSKRRDYDERQQALARVRKPRPTVPPPLPGSRQTQPAAGQVPTTSALPPAAAACALDATGSKVVARPSAAAERDATPTPTCGEAHAADSLRLVSQRKLIRGVLIVGVGAFVLLAATLVLNWPQSPSASTAAAASVAEEAPEPAAPLGPEPEGAPTAAISPAAADATPIATAEADAPTDEIELPPDVVASFDPEIGGQQALEAARDCFSENRLGKGVELGVSLRYDPASGLSNRVYLAPDHGLDRPERLCIKDRLVGLEAGGAPERATIVTYSLFLSRSGGRHHAHSSH